MGNKNILRIIFIVIITLLFIVGVIFSIIIGMLNIIQGLLLVCILGGVYGYIMDKLGVF